MGRVVQKYGGSSVADAESIKRVAKRIVATRQLGHDVVVVISAMGDTTDELMDLALQVSPLPPPRELDMLLTAGERMSAALLAMAIHDQGMHARSLTGSQAGIITTGTHGNARIIDITPGRITTRAGPGRHRDRGRLPGRRAGHQGRHHAGPGSLRHHGGGAGRLPGCGLLRDLLRRRRRLHRRPADRRVRPADPAHQLRGDARDGGLRGEDPASALRRVRPPGERPGACPVVLLREARHLDRRSRRER